MKKKLSTPVWYRHAADSHELLMIMGFPFQGSSCGTSNHSFAFDQTDFEATKTDDFYLLAMRV